MNTQNSPLTQILNYYLNFEKSYFVSLEKNNTIQAKLLLTLLFSVLVLAKLVGQDQRDLTDLSAAEQAVYQSLDTIVMSTHLDYAQKNALLSELSATIESIDFALGKALVAYQRAYLLSRQREHSAAIQQMDKAKVLLTISGDTFWQPTFYYLEGSIFLQQGDNESALPILQEAEASAQTQQQPHVETKTYRSLAILHQREGNVMKAFDYYHQALDLLLETDNVSGQAILLGNTGNLYWSVGDLTTAQEYYERAKLRFEQLKRPKYVATMLYNLGNIRMELEDPEGAKQLFQQSLDLRLTLDERTEVAYSRAALGAIDVLNKDYDAALKKLEAARAVAEATDDILLLVQTNYDIGKIYFDMKRYPQAQQELEKAQAQSKGKKTYGMQHKINQLLADIVAARGDFARAHALERSNRDITDSLPDNSLRQQLFKTELSFVEKEKELELGLLQKENELQEALLVRQRSTSRLLSILFGIVTLSLLSISYFFVRLRKRNYQLTKSNERIELQNEQIGQQNKLLGQLNQKLSLADQRQKESIEALENFAAIAAHDLKAPIRNASSFAGLLLKKHQNTFDQTDHKYFGFISDSLKRLTRMIEDLLSLSKLGQHLPPPEPVDCQLLITEVQAGLAQSIKASSASIVFSELPVVNGHQSLLMQLFQNLIDNGIKHASPNVAPLVSIHAEPANAPQGYVRFQVRDNGVGISERDLPFIFELFNGSVKQNSTGIGLATCKKIVRHYGGTIAVESELGKGTCILFSLPLATTAAHAQK